MDDSLVYNFTTLRLLTFSHINNCTIFDNNICLYFTCSRLLLLKNRPKLEIFNSLSRINCQSYALMLANLRMVKEATITYAHAVMSVLELRYFGAFNPAAYFCINGYIVLLPHNRVLFLTLFSSLTLALHDIICIVWTKERRFTDLKLRHFIHVRK